MEGDGRFLGLPLFTKPVSFASAQEARIGVSESKGSDDALMLKTTTLGTTVEEAGGAGPRTLVPEDAMTER